MYLKMSKNELSPELITKHQKVFNKLDLNGDGRVSMKEILEADLKLTRLDANMMISMADVNGDGKLNFEEYLIMIQIDTADDENLEKLVFKFFQKHQHYKDVIDTQFLSTALNILGQKLTIKETDDKLKAVKPKIPGKLNFKEFQMVCKRK